MMSYALLAVASVFTTAHIALTAVVTAVVSLPLVYWRLGAQARLDSGLAAVGQSAPVEHGWTAGLQCQRLACAGPGLRGARTLYGSAPARRPGPLGAGACACHHCGLCRQRDHHFRYALCAKHVPYYAAVPPEFRD